MRLIHCRRGLIAAFALAGLGALALAGCGTTGAAYGGGSGGNAPAGSSFKLTTKSVTVNGKATTVLADGNGKTLYYFTPDTPTSAACTGSCASKWPPLLLPSGSSLGQSTLPGSLKTASTANGSQVEYNGHLLYTFASDQSSTDAKGEGILGKWFVATPDLAAATGSSSAQPTATPAYNY